MNNDQINAYASALFQVAAAEGRVDEVEDELFRFGKAFESSDSLRSTLTDETIPPARRQSVVEELLGAKATSVTVQLVSFVVGSGRARDLPAIIARLGERAASTKKRAVAEVRSAVALTDDQKTRLAAALANATGQDIEVRVFVDPSVLGGVLAQVGDKVIDGTVRTRLDQLKSRL